MPSWRDEQPSVKQLNYAHELAEQLGLEDNYPWVASFWTKGEISDLINEFKRKLGYE
jgi:hypothetical protein